MKSLVWRHKVVIGIWLVVFGIVGYAGKVLLLNGSKNENPYVLSENVKK